jgi:hypothetical protein
MKLSKLEARTPFLVEPWFQATPSCETPFMSSLKVAPAAMKLFRKVSDTGCFQRRADTRCGPMPPRTPLSVSLSAVSIRRK